MKSWQDGKRELQREIARIFSLIDKNLTAEISDSSTVKIRKEELKILRENSAQIEKLVESNERLADELEKCRAAVTRVDSLEKENKKIAAELQLYIQLLKSTNENEHQTINSNVQASTKSATSSSEMIDLAQHQRLLKKYNTVSENCHQLKEAWVKMESKLREHKNREQNWNLHLEEKDDNIKKKKQRIKKLEQEVKDLKNRLSNENRFRISPSIEQELKSTPNHELEILQDVSDHDQEKNGNDSNSLVHLSCLKDSCKKQLFKSSSSNREMSFKFSLKDIPYPLTPTDTGNITRNKEPPIMEGLSSNATEINFDTTHREYVASNISVKEEPMLGVSALYDSPTIMPKSKKSIKQKEPHGNEYLTHIIKNELTKKKSFDKGHLQYLQESMDLDDIGDKIDTPRKGCNHIQTIKHANSSEYSSGSNIVQECQTVMCPVKKTVKSILSSGSNLSSCPNTQKATHKINNLNFSPNTTENCSTKKRCSYGIYHRRSPSRSPISEIADDAKLSPNTLNFSDTTGQRFKPPEPSNVITSPSILSDSKDELKNDSIKWDILNVSENKNKSSVCSLSKKIETPLPTENKILRTSNEIQLSKSCDKYQDKIIGSEIRSVPVSSPSIKQPTSPKYASRRSASTNKSSILPGKLRSRTVEELSIQDFKINPDYNQGYQFAFSEVIRGNRRNQLQGCLKPCCEPKYRALAEVSLNRLDLPTASQEEVDQLILEEFLGDNACKIVNMNPEERKELLIQAKTRDLANKHGLHRHAYEAPETPVGIWRANFPSTQEIIDEKKKVLKRKRKTVERRYAEAMRPGGAYKFRDE